MTRFRYLFVTGILLSWVTSLILEDAPHSANWSLLVDLGCTLTVFVFTISALIWKNRRAFTAFSLLLAVLIVGDSAIFVFRTNNRCGPRDHVLQSEVDAIEVAKEWVSKRNFYSLWGSTNGADVRDAMNRTPDCCGVTRSRNWDGVIVWRVDMEADRGADHISVEMQLSNCGEIFSDTFFSAMEPGKP
jgi:hypothetical protein